MLPCAQSQLNSSSWVSAEEKLFEEYTSFLELIFYSFN